MLARPISRKLRWACLTGVFFTAVASLSQQNQRPSGATQTDVNAALFEWYGDVTDGGQNTFYPEKTWSRYIEDRDRLERLLENPQAGAGSVAVLSTVARAAVLLENGEAAALIERAIESYLRFSRTGPRGVGAADFIRPLQIALMDTGDLALASEVNDRILQASKESGRDERSSSTMYDTAILETLGDHEAAERSLLSKLENQLKGVPEAAYAAMPPEYRGVFGAMNSAIYIRLAVNQAAQGKTSEARENLLRASEAASAFDATFRKVVEMGAGMKSLSVDGGQSPITSDFYTTGAETWLRLGEPELALQFADKASAEPMKIELHRRPDTEKSIALSANRHTEKKAQAIQILRGKALLALGRSAEAELAWQTALGLLKEPDSISKRAIPSFHPDVIAARQGLARALVIQGKTEEASEEALAIHESRMELISNLFGYASERQRLSFLQSADPYSLLAETAQIEKLAEAVIQLKGAVLDSVIEDRRNVAKSTSPESKELMRELRVARRLAINASLSGANDGEDWAAKAGTLEAQLGALTQTRGVVRKNLQVTTDQIRGALDDSDALCEFVRYHHFLTTGGAEPHYGALIFRKDRVIAWVPLGEATTIDAAVVHFNQGISGVIELSEEKMVADLSMLQARLITPIEPALEGASRLIVSPDGDLSRLSFAVLLDEKGKFLAEQWDLGYVSTARDLLEETNPLPGEVQLTIFADPDFSATQGTPESATSFRSISVPYSLSFPEIVSLPGTRKEMEVLREFGENAGWDVLAFSGREASEPQAAQMSSPTILHLATHGLFLEAQTAVTESGKHQTGVSSGRVDDPLQRSLLTLAGAQKTFNQWNRMEATEPSGDGILNAAEISLMDLEGTWLATLSACDTAAGESIGGEGVMGLRRGFFLAGVDHLLMTFWPIADEETVALMEGFYKELPTSGHPAAALSMVQREALSRFREEQGLLRAVLLAGPFAVSFSGGLPKNDSLPR